MELDYYLLELEEKSEKPINHFKFEMSKISTGRANPQIIKGIKVLYYESMTPLEELSNISVPEPQQLLIKPYDITSIKDICKAMEKANLGIMPVDEGNQIRLTFPTLTIERRREMIKNLGKLSETAKVGIRNVRQDVNKLIKADEELSEDDQKKYLEKVQKNVDILIEKVNSLTKEKENELMNK
ncbi:ribosome recycling factor [Mycoplasmopsis cynos]|uniref:Ribosome-recycling factor n=1 Tax=Mycoplasmopsis cynos TaxID=171284 RepID=A0A449AJJ6_9BACT|nr:ribosome recycling factor [Mycoplasmopsis cynos]MCU9932610.1 ribosome recycling factor [Mycoplasmopsis cynos]MCU9935121.1 ribosome recycling factor [Mycoplasmopsis cynos]TQC54701.1 ribosome recycling factor [Mycoplasmopsis cynos]UWV80677.1 ribosome recycling factor [Mycoplasmopsis cynos]UWV86184.1 ribosome recycling factor [Mycoplasmopsis cynos]